MTGFRGSDEALEREIAAIERIARIRVRRVSAELGALSRDLRELRLERARRRADAAGPGAAAVVAETAAERP
jgi:hypothetical protein